MENEFDALREMAATVCRRGQTIYGRKMMVDLCSKSGVSLLDEASFGDVAADTSEGLEDFLVRYAQLGSAARLTLSVLAKQYGVRLPAEIAKKRMTLKDIIKALPDFLT